MKNYHSKLMVILTIFMLLGVSIGTYIWYRNSSDTINTEESQRQEDETRLSIFKTAEETSSLSTLVAAISKAGLAETLSNNGPFTVLAPDNNAFSQILETFEISSEELLDRTDLYELLSYHVISDDINSGDLFDGMELTTIEGGTLVVNTSEEGTYFVDASGNRALVTTQDVKAGNGTIHIIGSVLFP